MKERLQKLLAQANIASRRASEDLITRGRVRVNGAIARLGDKADPAQDVIEVDGTRLNFETRARIFIALNKPKHVLTTDKPHRTDQRQTVNDLIGRDEHLFSIGRLDADSEGLVVMTNDGETAQRLSHPRYRHTKTYRVEVHGLPSPETLEKWQQGIFLEEGKAAPCLVEIVKGSVKGTTLRIVMTEGKKRQIRRVAAALGHPVERLVRTHIGMFALGDLAPGASRELNAKEILALSTPSPEIKRLRAEMRRSSQPPDEEPAKPRARRAQSLDLPANPRRGARTAATEDEASDGAPTRRPARRARREEVQDEQQQRRPRPPAAPDDDRRRTPRTKPAASSDDTTPERKRAPRSKPAGAPAGAPADKRRTPRPARKPGNRKPSGRKGSPR